MECEVKYDKSARFLFYVGRNSVRIDIDHDRGMDTAVGSVETAGKGMERADGKREG